MQLQNLKRIYISGLQQLDASAVELYGNSQLDFGNLSAEIPSHASAIAKVGIVFPALNCFYLCINAFHRNIHIYCSLLVKVSQRVKLYSRN